MNRPKHLMDHIATLHDERYSQHYIANLLGVNHSIISRVIKRFNEMK